MAIEALVMASDARVERALQVPRVWGGPKKAQTRVCLGQAVLVMCRGPTAGLLGSCCPLSVGRGRSPASQMREPEVAMGPVDTGV